MATILIAPDSFKGSLSAIEAARAMADGWMAVRPGDELVLLPVADGGEGTVSTLIAAAGGDIRTATVHDPLGRLITAHWGLLADGRTGVVEVAEASGLTRVDPYLRNPMKTTSYGTGELLRQAFAVCDEIIVGLGGSATNDCGLGLAQALGYRFFLADDSLLKDLGAGEHLAKVAAIDASARDERLGHVGVIAACDVTNPLYGPQGAAQMFAPQKGATPRQVKLLDAALAHFAEIIQRDLGLAVAEMPGAGAVGGLGAAIPAFLNGQLQSGIDLVLDALQFNEFLQRADLVLTGEGRIDRQTVYGKVVAGVARRAHAAGKPVIAFAGQLQDEAMLKEHLHLRALHSINPGNITTEESLAQANQLLARAAASCAASSCF